MATFTVLLDLLLQCPILNGEFYREMLIYKINRLKNGSQK